MSNTDEMIRRWRKDAALYQQQVDEARAKGLPHDQMLAMATCLKSCADELEGDAVPEIVPFQEAQLDGHDVKLFDGKVYKLDGDRRIEVWKVRDEDGLCFRIFRPTVDGKISKLAFGLSDDACHALYLTLAQHLGPAEPYLDEMLTFIREQMHIWDGDGDSGFPLYELGKKILARYPPKGQP